MLRFIFIWMVVITQVVGNQNPDCADVECPRVIDCVQTYIPTGECCPKCDCNTQMNTPYSYSWDEFEKPCRLCTCDLFKREDCSRFQCPNQEHFKNCKKPKWNFFCGCKVSCEKSETPSRPKFPKIPGFPNIPGFP